MKCEILHFGLRGPFGPCHAMLLVLVDAVWASNMAKNATG